MNRKLIKPNLNDFPKIFHPLFKNADVYDSSCSSEAKVVFVDRDGGYFLKCAPKGTLAIEAELTRFFHKKQLAADVLDYVSEEKDWLLTERLKGEDCTYRKYLDNPCRLCDTAAELLRRLHNADYTGCPVADRCYSYYATAEKNYRNKNYDTSLFPDNWGYRSAEEAWQVICENRHLLRSDTLLHGDYCLPNIIFDKWRFSGFVDLGSGGVGDRHIDLFWGAWTLFFNLKTDKYRERFFDAYGREKIEPDMFRVIAAFEVFG